MRGKIRQVRIMDKKNEYVGDRILICAKCGKKVRVQKYCGGEPFYWCGNCRKENSNG